MAEREDGHDDASLAPGFGGRVGRLSLAICIVGAGFCSPEFPNKQVVDVNSQTTTSRPWAGCHEPRMPCWLDERDRAVKARTNPLGIVIGSRQPGSSTSSPWDSAPGQRTGDRPRRVSVRGVTVGQGPALLLSRSTLVNAHEDWRPGSTADSQPIVTDGSFESNERPPNAARADGSPLLRRNAESSVAAQTEVSAQTTVDRHRRITVRVLDAATRAGIAGAEVTAEVPQGGDTVAHRYISSSEGVVELTTLQSRLLVVSASADGYLPSAMTVAGVGENARLHTIEVLLHRQNSPAEVRVRLPNDRPAGGADAHIVHYLGEWPPFWQARSDEHGLLTLPVVGWPTVLLLRHRDAGFAVAQLPDAVDHNGPTIIQLPFAGPPLTVQVTRPDGAPVESAMVFLATDALGGWAVGRTLQWLTWSDRSTTGSDGTWVGYGIPVRRVRLAVRQSSSEAGPFTIDNTRIATVHFPWLGPVVLKVSEQ